MSRPTLEVADIVRQTGNSFCEQQQAHLAWPHRKVLDALVRCRTTALGGHRDRSVRCGHQAISFNSCRNPSTPSELRPEVTKLLNRAWAAAAFHCEYKNKLEAVNGISVAEPQRRLYISSRFPDNTVARHSFLSD